MLIKFWKNKKTEKCCNKPENTKPIVEIKGELCYELKKGYRAFVQETGGEQFMTSQVVDIRNETSTGVEIETQNTIYKLTYATVQAAA